MPSKSAILVSTFPLILQGSEKVRTAADGTKELIVLDHCGDPDSCGRKRGFDPDYARQEAHANGIGERYMRRKGQGYFKLGAGGYRLVEVEKNAAGADVLGFSMELISALEFDDGR